MTPGWEVFFFPLGRARFSWLGARLAIKTCAGMSRPAGTPMPGRATARVHEAVEGWTTPCPSSPGRMNAAIDLLCLFDLFRDRREKKRRVARDDMVSGGIEERLAVGKGPNVARLDAIRAGERPPSRQVVVHVDAVGGFFSTRPEKKKKRQRRPHTANSFQPTQQQSAVGGGGPGAFSTRVSLARSFGAPSRTAARRVSTSLAGRARCSAGRIEPCAERRPFSIHRPTTRIFWSGRLSLSDGRSADVTPRWIGLDNLGTSTASGAWLCSKPAALDV